MFPEQIVHSVAAAAKDYQVLAVAAVGIEAKLELKQRQKALQHFACKRKKSMKRRIGMYPLVESVKELTRSNALRIFVPYKDVDYRSLRLHAIVREHDQAVSFVDQEEMKLRECRIETL